MLENKDTAGNPVIAGTTISYDCLAAAASQGTPTVPFYLCTPIQPSTFNMSHWTALPLTHHLGLPLRYQKAGERDTSTHRRNLPRNECLELLTIDIDPDSETFGESADSWNYEIIVNRADAEDTPEMVPKALQAYIKLALADVIAYGAVKATAKRNAKSRKNARKRAMEAADKAHAEDLDSFLAGFVRDAFCDKCGAPDGWRETTLSKKGKCSKCQENGEEQDKCSSGETAK